MNTHHLELFYYVAKHGGIAAAVRKMPYGIQQPVVSGQIARFEEAFGAKLFNRRPFSLLPAGAELFEFIRPFFDDVEKVAGRIRGGSKQLRIAAPSIVAGGRNRSVDHNHRQQPGFKPPPGVRVIPLPSFPPVVVGATWAGKLSPIAQQFLAEVEIEATVVRGNSRRG